MSIYPLSHGIRVHVFQHIEGEGLSSLSHWMQTHDTQVNCTRFFAWQTEQPLPTLPHIEDVDLLIIMGGAMSVNDEQDYPWLVPEKQWIAHYVRSGRAAIGLCLGAQLIANALGATVQGNSHKEIGWWPVERIPAADIVSTLDVDSIFAFPPSLTALSWHGDTFALPEQAIHLARSEACANQAYQWGRRVLAFQFHPESTPASVQLFLADDGYKELVDGPYIQTAETLQSQSLATFDEPNRLLERAIDYVLGPEHI